MPDPSHWNDGIDEDPTKVLSKPKIGKLLTLASVAIKTLARFGLMSAVVPTESDKTKVTSDGVGFEIFIALFVVEPPGPVISGKNPKTLEPKSVSPEYTQSEPS